MTAIERVLEFRLMASPNVKGGHGTIQVSYDSAEPWTIHLALPTYEWRVDRDLIAEGCINDAGDGDVYVQVGEDGVYFHLRDQAGGEGIVSAHRNVADNSTATINATLGLLFSIAALAVALLRPDLVAWLASIPAGWRIFLIPISVALLLWVVWVLLSWLLPEVRNDTPGRHRRDARQRQVTA